MALRLTISTVTFKHCGFAMLYVHEGNRCKPLVSASADANGRLVAFAHALDTDGKEVARSPLSDVDVRRFVPFCRPLAGEVIP